MTIKSLYQMKGLLLGILIGVVLGLSLNYFMRCHIGHGKYHERKMDQFISQLDLTPKQQTDIRTILDQQRQEMKSIRAQMRPQIEEIRQNTRQKIKEHLNSDQIILFDQMKHKRRH